MIRLLYVIGTRPEAIRSARLLRLMSDNRSIELNLLNTGQHYDANMMSDFLRDLDVPTPDHNLRVGSLPPARQTARIMDGAADLLAEHPVDAVVVFGDTNSTLGCGLAAVKHGVPLVHVEAGCRSYDMSMPEEINRRIVDHTAGLLLAVSPANEAALRREGVLGRIEVAGDPQFDVFRSTSAGMQRSTSDRGLVTIHREENADDEQRLARILDELDQVTERTGVRWIFPVHPRTRKQLGSSSVPESIELVDPLGYTDLLTHLFAAPVCVTDSGGLQKEALWARVPCVTVRDRTEWIETIEQGANVLVSAEGDIADQIVRQVEAVDTIDFSNPYGNDDCSGRAFELIEQWVASGDGAAWARTTSG